MTDTIREKTRKWLGEGNLISYDEHKAAIAAAERKGMERAIDCIRNSHRLSTPVCEHLVVEIRADLETKP